VKKSLHIAAIILPCLLAASCSGREELAATSAPGIEPDTICNIDPSLFSDRGIIEFSEDFITEIESSISNSGDVLQTKSKIFNETLASLGVDGLERLYPDAGEWEPRHREAGLHRWYRVHFNKADAAQLAGEKFGVTGAVVYYEQERKIKQNALFNDPYYRRQWDFYNDGKTTAGTKSGCDINVEPVWEKYTAGSKGVIVSVVDGGVQYDHPDLSGVVITAGKEGSRNFFNGNYKITPTTHGTHVAGTIAAINNNGEGVCGIAGGKDGTGGVRILNSQVFVEDENWGNGFYEGMVWGADHGAVISQNSWGNVYNSKEEAARGSVGPMKGAIDYFIKYAGTDQKGNQTGPMKGGVVFFAAGNDGWPDGWPAEYDGGSGECHGKCIAVGSTAGDFTRAYYSNYGDWVDIAAPGGDQSKGQMIVSTILGSQYAGLQGTSMACPHVSGVAALIVSYFGGPGFTNDMLVDILLNGAREDALPRTAKIGPLLDAYGSFNAGTKIPPEKITDYSVKASANTLNYTWKIPSDKDDVTPFACMMLSSVNASDFGSSFDPRNIPETVKRTVIEVPSGAKVGDEMTGYIENLEFDTKYYVTMISYDYGRNYSDLSDVKFCKTLENDPPVIQTEYTGDYSVHSFQTLVVDYDIFDPNRHSVKVEFDAGSQAASLKYLGNSQSGDGTYRMTIVGTGDNDGNYSAVFHITDQYGAKTEKVIKYTLLPNHPPKIVEQVENQLFSVIGKSVELDMSKYISDEDGEILRYTAEASEQNVVYVNQSENTLLLTSLNYGKTDITIVGRDAKDESVTMTFKVAVRDPKSAADVYPTKVSDYLYVCSGTEALTKIVIRTATGAEAFSTTVTTDVFHPARIDMSKFAPGQYKVYVSTDSSETVKSIVKL